MNCIKKLLLVNDNVIINYTIGQLMEETDIVQEFVVSENGLEAFVYLTEHCTREGVFSLDQCPDVILLNWGMMPQMGGQALLEEIRSLGLDVLLKRVIIIGRPPQGYEYGGALPFGIRGHLNLPITEESLRSLIYWMF